MLPPLFDPHLSAHSYWFRYGKRTYQAARSVEAAYPEGYSHAADCDLKSYFDTVSPSRLLRLLVQWVTDRRVLRLIGDRGIGEFQYAPERVVWSQVETYSPLRELVIGFVVDVN